MLENNRTFIFSFTLIAANLFAIVLYMAAQHSKADNQLENIMSAINKIQENTFAEACYECNTIKQLEHALTIEADKDDMEQWGITADEWREQIKLAIAALQEKASDAA